MSIFWWSVGKLSGKLSDVSNKTVWRTCFPYTTNFINLCRAAEQDLPSAPKHQSSTCLPSVYKTLFFHSSHSQREIHESYSCMPQIFAAYLCLPQIFVAYSVCPSRMSVPQSFEAFKKKAQMTEAYWVCRKYLWHTWVCRKCLRHTQVCRKYLWHTRVWLVYLNLRMGGMKK